jgi:hypothetical protein
MALEENRSMDGISAEESINEPLTRDSLYALVWSEPMLKVGARFGVSSSYMARICTLLNVPRPERGYWAKLAVGKAPKKPPLPEPKPGDHLVWSRDGSSIRVPKALPRPPARRTRAVRMPSLLNDQHSLLQGAIAHFEAGRLSYEGKYLKPTKKLLIDLAVTKPSLDKTLTFANQLFLSLEDSGHRVLIAPNDEHFRRAEVDEREKPGKGYHHNNLWSPCRETVVYVGTLAIGLTIIEMSEEVEVRHVNGEYVRVEDYVPPKRSRYAVDHTWTSRMNLPTGRLCLQAYSPYPRAKWVHQWRETQDRDLGSQIKAIVKGLEQAAIQIAGLVEEGERQAQIEHEKWEAQHAQWLRAEAERLAAKALKDSKEDIYRIIDRWAEVNRIEQFFSDAERRAADLEDEERIRLLDRLKRARELIGSADALEHFMIWKTPEER